MYIVWNYSLVDFGFLGKVVSFFLQFDSVLCIID